MRHAQDVQVVDLVDRLPVLWSRVTECRVEPDVMTDVVDEHVETSVVGEHPILHRFDRRGIADIEHVALTATARLVDLVDYGGRTAFAVVDDDHMCAVPCKEQRGRRADRAGAAGDQRHSVGEKGAGPVVVVVHEPRNLADHPSRPLSYSCGMAITVTPTGATLGAYVTGVALRSIDDEQWGEVEKAWHE